MFAPAIIENFEQIIVSREQICCHFADENSTGLPAQKTRHLPSKPMKKRNSPWRMMLWTSMAVIGWFACKSLSDWVRYLVIVMCTGKSGIFRGQPVSLRGSNPDYSGRSASRVNTGSLKALVHIETQSHDLISCYRKLVVQTIAVRGAGFLKWLVGSWCWVSKWIGALSRHVSLSWVLRKWPCPIFADLQSWCTYVSFQSLFHFIAIHSHCSLMFLFRCSAPEFQLGHLLADYKIHCSS